MRDKTIVIVSLLVASMMLSFAAIPVMAFYHPSTGLEDGEHEIFGPRIDRILVKMYGTLEAEIAALQNGEIDITDWALTKPLITTLGADPNVVVLGYGGEAGYYELNFNNNDNLYLGNPPNPIAPNPVRPDPDGPGGLEATHNPMSDISFRQAVSMSINNTYLCSVLGEGLYDPIYTPIPAYMAFWIHPDIKPGGSLAALTYPYDGPAFAVAKALLLAAGFKVNPGTGFRYWDRNSDDTEQANEAVNLKVYTRMDILRAAAGDMEEQGLIAMQIRYTRTPCDGAVGYQNCMVDQDYHSYTCGWINVGPDPDGMYDLYSYDNYFWDGENGPANWAAIGKYNSAQNDDLWTLKNAADPATALAAARDFQVKFAADACEKPLAATSAPKAFSKYYTGGNDGTIVDPDDGENAYRGQMWDDIVNQNGFGENSWWSTLNMHPQATEWGDGSHMTVRYGWEQTGMPVKINPIYSSWYWESEIWGRVMDGGGARDPMTLGPVEVPQLMENWTQGTWVDNGITKAKVTVKLRPDVMWSDGYPVTIDDFIYTLAILPGELVAKNCSRAWWQATLDQVQGYFRLDNYTAEILMQSNTYLASTWIVGNVILPKHFWQPYVAANINTVIMGDLGTNLIGSGPFKYTAISPGTTVTMVRNPTYYQPDEVGVIKEDPQSGIEFTAASPSTQISPVKIKDVNITHPGPDGYFDLKVTVQNLNKRNSVTFDETITITYAGPNAPLPPVTLLATGSHTLTPGATFVYTNSSMHVRDGLHRIDVTVHKTGGVAHTSSKYVWITVAGDLTGDFKANILDITQIAIRFGSLRGEAKYDAIADINHDNKINIVDIVQVALVFGWTAFGP